MVERLFPVIFKLQDKPGPAGTAPAGEAKISLRRGMVERLFPVIF